MTADVRGDVPLTIRVIDSHTEGEPTRVVVDGWPQPAGETMEARRDDLRDHWDHLRRAVVCEPRGHSAVVGALLTPPVNAGSLSGIIFFNNGTYLGMCGHGLIGVVRTLQHLGRMTAGVARFDTPVGTVSAELNADGSVTIENVPSRCHALDVVVEVPEAPGGKVVGDVAWGGNWFFITHLDQSLEISNVGELTRVTQRIQDAIWEQRVAGGVPIDHIEVSAAPSRADADARNFVLCSGGDYDRSPCGTGTSAVMAALHKRGRLAFDTEWRQESITGSRFVGWLTPGSDGEVIPHVRGSAFVTGEATLRFDPADPFRFGIGTAAS
ncbi:MAG TPA: proline racemase family protein [Gemmatimonadaceae bacterium]|nr:proline racemase family protein [Gemmatimonadaceae bacterium]